MKKLMVLVALGLLLASGPYREAASAERTKIYDSRNRQVGDIYDPGHGRRLQIRDNNRRIIGYVERSGKITDTRRRKVGEVNDD